MMSPELPMGELTAAEYSVGGVKFYIDLLPAKTATPIFRAILHELRNVDFDALGDSLRELDGDDDALNRIGLRLLHQLTRISPEFIDWLEAQMFRHVRFQSASTTPQMLAGAEDKAFDGLTVFDLHEVLVRSLARNFFGQFGVYRSRRGGVQPPPSSGGL